MVGATETDAFQPTRPICDQYSLWYIGFIGQPWTWYLSVDRKINGNVIFSEYREAFSSFTFFENILHSNDLWHRLTSIRWQMSDFNQDTADFGEKLKKVSLIYEQLKSQWATKFILQRYTSPVQNFTKIIRAHISWHFFCRFFA